MLEENVIDTITFLLAIVVVCLFIWASKISRRDMFHSFAVITLIAVVIFAAGKFLDALSLGFFGTNLFSDILELILMLGLLAAMLSFYGKWRQED
jgi:maltodextrin utilization protein YvdJ